LAATPADESAVEILLAAAHDHIPVNPSIRDLIPSSSNDPSLNQSIPDSADRPSIEQIMREITGRQSDDYETEDLNEFTGLEWYKGQVAYRRTFDATIGRMGISVVFCREKDRP